MIDPQCAYHCNDENEVLDIIHGRLVPCPTCSKIMQDSVADRKTPQGIPLYKVLGFNRDPGLSGVFDYDKVIPDVVKIKYSSESIDSQRDSYKNLWDAIVRGDDLDQSWCFGIGSKGNLDVFIYPLLVEAYKNGKSVSQLTSITSIDRLYEFSKGADAYESLLRSYLLVTVLDEGINAHGVATAKSLMQSRSLKGLATVFVTTGSSDTVETLLSVPGQHKLFLATPSFVESLVDSNSEC